MKHWKRGLPLRRQVLDGQMDRQGRFTACASQNLAHSRHPGNPAVAKGAGGGQRIVHSSGFYES